MFYQEKIEKYLDSFEAGDVQIIVIGHDLKNVQFRRAFAKKGESSDGKEGKLAYSNDQQINVINQVKLLYYAVLDNKDSLIDYIPIDVANNFLIHLKVNEGLEDTNQFTNGLLSYFERLLDWRLDWDQFEYRSSLKPTYKFKKYLEDCVKSKEASQHLAFTTANNYISAVRRMYVHYLYRGFEFAHPPFEYEVVAHVVDSTASSMSPTQKILIETTDLRLSAPKKSKKEKQRPLQALNQKEIEAFDKVIRKDRAVITLGKHKRVIQKKLAIEISLFLMILRWVGLRRNEGLTLRESHIFLPSIEQIKVGMVKVDIGPDSGVHTKNSVSRTVEFPSLLMKRLYEYVHSPRYHKRKERFLKNIHNQVEQYLLRCEAKSIIPDPEKLEEIRNQEPFIFLNNQGTRYTHATMNARWAEIKNTIQSIGVPFTHKLHNLRATYAVLTLRAMLNAGVKRGEARDRLKALLGHEEEETLDHYLGQAELEPVANEVAERVIEYLFDGFDFSMEN